MAIISKKSILIIFIVDILLPRSRTLDAGIEPIVSLRKVMAAPEDAKTFLLEILKFVLTVGLIMATGVVLLMVG